MTGPSELLGMGVVVASRARLALSYWHVDDVTATFEKLRSMGAQEYEPPTERGPGFVTVAVVDPFGNVLGVMYNAHYLEVLASMRTE
jgi:predicted enzyme related to lactoylglutathione lyase